MARKTGQLGGAVGLGLLADATSLTVSILTGATLLAAAAPLHLIANQPLPHDGGTTNGAAPKPPPSPPHPQASGRNNR